MHEINVALPAGIVQNTKQAVLASPVQGPQQDALCCLQQQQREATPAQAPSRRGGSLHVERASLPSPFEATLERALSAKTGASAGAGAGASTSTGATTESAVERLARRMSIDLYDSATGSHQGSCTLSGAPLSCVCQYRLQGLPASLSCAVFRCLAASDYPACPLHAHDESFTSLSLVLEGQPLRQALHYACIMLYPSPLHN